jgi:predicted O-methyltransferase YrrM
VQDTLGPFLAETPGLRISLLHLDMDIYEPTKFALERLWDLVVPGGVIVMDEYATPPWAGESTAWEEFAAARGLALTIRKFPWALTPGGYVIKPGA